MIKLTLNGKPLDETNIEAALLDAYAAKVREQLGAIRHPETGEFPTVSFSGDLSNLRCNIEGTPELLALVSAQLQDENSSGVESAADDDAASVVEGSAPKAFLSYASEDREIAGNIAAALMSGGVDTWWDGWSIGPGDSIRQRIDEGIGNCTHFIVLLTSRSINKAWVNTEIDAGFMRKLGSGITFIPLRCALDVGALPPLLQTLHSPLISAENPDPTQLIRDIHGFTRRPRLGATPEPILKARTTDSAFSPAAMSLAKYFVDRSDHGRDFDVQKDPAEVARELGLSEEDLSDAIYELRGMVINHHGLMIRPHETLFATFDKYWRPWDPADDAVRLAANMVNGDNFPSDPPAMAARLGWPARRFNPALAYLVARDLVSDARSCFRNDGFTSISVRRTDATRRFVKSRS